MELEKIAPADFALLEGERVDSTLRAGNGQVEPGDEETMYLMLTDRRLIHVSVDGRRGGATFVSLQDVTAIDIRRQREGGLAGYLWGALAMVVAVLVWRAWDQPVWSVVAALAVAAMGAYLVVDRRLSPHGLRASFRAGAEVLHFTSRGTDDVAEIYGFVNRVFQLKDEGAARGPRRPGTFAPR
jgi:hypothetical protein